MAEKTEFTGINSHKENKGKSIHVRSVKVAPLDPTQGSTSMLGQKSAWDTVRARYRTGKGPSTETQVKPFSDLENESDRTANCPNISTVSQVFRSKRFSDPKLERLYQRYFFKLNQNNLTILMGVLSVISVLLIIFYYVSGATLPARGINLGIIFFALIVLQVVCNKGSFDQQQMVIVSYIILALVCGITILITLDSDPRTVSDGVWCTVIFIYLIYTMLPIRMRLSVLSGVIVSVIHLGCTLRRNFGDSFLWKQVSLREYFCIPFKTSKSEFTSVCLKSYIHIFFISLKLTLHREVTIDLNLFFIVLTGMLYCLACWHLNKSEVRVEQVSNVALDRRFLCTINSQVS